MLPRSIAGRHCVLETGFLTGVDVAFEVLDPPELRDLLRDLAARYTAAAGPS